MITVTAIHHGCYTHIVETEQCAYLIMAMAGEKEITWHVQLMAGSSTLRERFCPTVIDALKVIYQHHKGK